LKSRLSPKEKRAESQPSWDLREKDFVLTAFFDLEGGKASSKNPKALLYKCHGCNKDISQDSTKGFSNLKSHIISVNGHVIQETAQNILKH
jgi:hypothetical protein